MCVKLRRYVEYEYKKEKKKLPLFFLVSELLPFIFFSRYPDACHNKVTIWNINIYISYETFTYLVMAASG